MRINQKNNINISDLSLAAYLALRFSSFDLQLTSEGKFAFIFQDSEELQTYINSFYNNTASVSPRDYFNSIKNIKGRMYQGR